MFSVCYIFSTHHFVIFEKLKSNLFIFHLYGSEVSRQRISITQGLQYNIVSYDAGIKIFESNNIHSPLVAA